MGWIDKEMRKHKVHSMVEQAMKDPRFQEAEKRKIDEATRNSFNSFLLISVDYLYRHCEYNREQILKFMEFVIEQLDFIQNDEEYFNLLNAELMDELDINILNV